MTDKMDTNKLGTFLREVSGWNWEAFCRAEADPQYTSNQAMIFALVRACAMEKMDAIKLALNRIDGKLKTPVKIEYPKIYYVFPNARFGEPVTVHGPAKVVPFSDGRHAGEWEGPDSITSVSEPGEDDMTYELVPSEPPDEAPPEENDLPSLSLRQTLAKMSDHPRQVPDAVIAYADATQQWLNGQGDEPVEKPMVKSVVAAHLLKMAQRRDVGALTEVFDQIDGKLAETIQILGEDIFITSYSLTAPDGAYFNADGVLQLEAEQAQKLWAAKLGGQ